VLGGQRSKFKGFTIQNEGFFLGLNRIYWGYGKMMNSMIEIGDILAKNVGLKHLKNLGS